MRAVRSGWARWGAVAAIAGALVLGTAGPATAAPIDTSPAALQRFEAEWYAEVITVSGAGTAAPKVLDAGRAVCNSLNADPNANPEALARAAAETYGFAVADGQAVTAAALRALCPALDRGYRTNWDKTVQLMQDDIARNTGVAPTAASTNRTLRVGCGPYRQTSTPRVDVVRATLIANGAWPVDASGRQAPFEVIMPNLSVRCGGAPPLYPLGS